MRKLAVALVLLAVLARGSKPAEAHCQPDCPAWLDVLGWTLGVGFVGGYAGGTGYFIYRDATDARQSLEYGVTELGIHGALGGVLLASAVDAVGDHPGSAVALGALGLTHSALAVHGAWRSYQHRDELRPPARTLEAIAGVAYTANALLWAAQIPERHGARYGIAEAAVNAPMAAGLGYLAALRARSGDTRYAALFGGMAAVSGALAIHGAYTALAPRHSASSEIDFGLDLGLGAEVAPTVVSDGKVVAPGVGASGTW
jgi:hypothetical protein